MGYKNITILDPFENISMTLLKYKFNKHLVINLHFISILTALSNPTEKIHMELNATDIEFSTQFSRVDVQFIFTYSRSQ